MKKTLIINLRRFGDVLATSHLIKDLKGSDPTQQIYLLTMKEFEKITNIMKGIEDVYTIDRLNILNLTKNKIYDDARALNSFTKDIQSLKNTYWDEIINFSNDKVSTYITSFLKQKNPSAKISGIYFDDKKNLISNNKWSEVFNEVMTTYRHSPIHFNDLYRNICELDYDDNFWKAPITNAKNDDIAKKNFDQIREHQECDGVAPKIIGIQLKASSNEKEIDIKEISELINIIFDDQTLYPVLLIAPFENERKIAEKLSEEYGNTLVIVEADLVAISSVIKQLDLLVTPDTLIKHLGDLYNIPMVEVSRGPSPYLKQGTITEGNFVLTSKFSTRFNSNTPEERISANDIYQCIYKLIKDIPSDQVKLSPGITLYKSERDKLGQNYKYVSGVFEVEHELSRLFSRQLLHNLINNELNLETSAIMGPVNSAEAKSWISTEIGHLTHCTKALLSTIRDLKQAQANAKNGGKFAQSIDRLISFADMNHVCSISVALFRGRLDSILQPSKDVIETLAYELKNELQITLKTLKQFETSIIEEEKETLTNKYSRIVENSIEEFIS